MINKAIQFETTKGQPVQILEHRGQFINPTTGEPVSHGYVKVLLNGAVQIMKRSNLRRAK